MEGWRSCDFVSLPLSPSRKSPEIDVPRRGALPPKSSTDLCFLSESFPVPASRVLSAFCMGKAAPVTMGAL